jgi:putative N6-adenine-specific DNA methylase
VTSTVSRFRYFVAVSPGLESLLLAELDRLGISGKITPGGVEVSGSIETLWAIHHGSRLAESVRVRLRPFDATSFAQLEQGLKRLPWHAYLRSGFPFDISVTSQNSRLYHTDAIAERVRRVIDECSRTRDASTIHLGQGIDPSQTGSMEQRLHVRLMRDAVQVSIDASGERLHRRGYRTHVGHAPLRETLAAAAIQLLLDMRPSGSVVTLWDPCCGSGTLLGEWLLMCSHALPCQTRSFAFESWPIHDRRGYLDWLEQRPPPQAAPLDCQGFGSDIEARSIAAARHNLARAGVAQRCTLHAQDFRDVVRRIPPNTAVATNLPYGVRLQDNKTASRLFIALDQLLHTRSDLRPVVVLDTIAPPNQAHCSWHRAATFANGGLRVNAWSLI